MGQETWANRVVFGRVAIIAWSMTLTAGTAFFGERGWADDGIDFKRDIQPILAKYCLECHGPERDASSYRVDRWPIIHDGGEYGVPAIVPGEPDSSFLIQVLEGGSEDLTMPPDGHEAPSPVEIQRLRSWIKSGAEVPQQEMSGEDPLDWWSLRPLQRVSPPTPSVAKSGDSVIDLWVGHGLETAGLDFSPSADRRALIRRLYLVMLGLPPSPAEVEGFVNDSDPMAWPKLVDRVLASPHYGERWARHWLDVVRFGETDGYETNRERPNAWRYRDWVIDAFNRDMPYDDFVKFQIAGDAWGQPIGTSFLVGGPHDIVKSPDRRLTLTQRQDELSDMVGTVGSAFLGLTIGCARCHYHKFDPISQTDFYELQAIFSGVYHGESPLPHDPTVQSEEQRRWQDERMRWQSQLLTYLETQDLDSIVWPPVQAVFNIEVFAPREARMVRFVIDETLGGGEPCLDELEIFSGSDAVGLASQGASVTSSGDYAGNPKHRLEHINDQRFGNDYSWISNTPGRGWVQIEWSEPVQVDRIQWARDRMGSFSDRLATNYRIEVSLDGQHWDTVASSDSRLPQGSKAASFYNQPVVDRQTERPDGAESVSVVKDSGETWGGWLERLLKQQQQWASAPVAFAGVFRAPEPIYRLFRGDPLSPKEQVVPNTLGIWGDLALSENASDQERRVALATALTDGRNPLLARVIVNRLWQYQFGTGLVETSSDFGRNAALPTHPDLLDELALKLQANGWSLKSLQREILLSRTWQQSSLPRAEGLAVDAGGRLLWRFPPRRLEAEAIRDQILAVSGQLRHVGGGPGFSAFEVDLENVRHYHPLSSYDSSHFRRMIYQTKVRQEQDAVFGAFDCPDGTQIAPQRSRSTTPLQALNLFNSEFVLQQAEAMSQRLQAEVGDDVGAQLSLAYQWCFSRLPEGEETEAGLEFIQDQGLSAFCRVMLNSNEFLFVP